MLARICGSHHHRSIPAYKVFNKSKMSIKFYSTVHFLHFLLKLKVEHDAQELNLLSGNLINQLVVPVLPQINIYEWAVF